MVFPSARRMPAPARRSMPPGTHRWARRRPTRRFRGSCTGSYASVMIMRGWSPRPGRAVTCAPRLRVRRPSWSALPARSREGRADSGPGVRQRVQPAGRAAGRVPGAVGKARGAGAVGGWGAVGAGPRESAGAHRGVTCRGRGCHSHEMREERDHPLAGEHPRTTRDWVV